MVFFFSNMIENQLMSTGAFEITLNGEFLFCYMSLVNDFCWLGLVDRNVVFWCVLIAFGWSLTSKVSVWEGVTRPTFIVLQYIRTDQPTFQIRVYLSQ